MPVSLTDQPLAAGTPRRPDSPIVLVVDAEPEAGETTATNLRRRGLRVRTALTAEFALDLCNTIRFAAVVLDSHLAEAYCKGLLQDALDVGVVVIVSTAGSDQVALSKEHYRDKVFAVVNEPVTPSELTRVVQAAVNETQRLRCDEPVQEAMTVSEIQDLSRPSDIETRRDSERRRT